MAALTVVPRRSKARGHADLGWLNTYHTFSFADYYDPQFMEFGPLRVLNEDRVKAKTGFGKHPHREYEIFSYILSGELEHRDSLGNVEILKRGDVQFTTAGSGITHSEKNDHPNKTCHFLQIWVKPDFAYLDPGYVTQTFSDANKTNRLLPIVSPYLDTTNAPTDASSTTVLDNTIGVHTDLFTFACTLEPGQSVVHSVQSAHPNRKAKSSGNGARRLYLHVVDQTGAITIVDSNTTLQAGDGAFVTEVKSRQTLELSNPTSEKVEFLLFDMA
ncbi:hypothetical protein H4R34_004321 [Dimargaris verticillata]|uniref:Pirin N-terminal domain-containing protein n=1 Tax=Dimargaris verticillata TaxID=2761393 RepID=A0A9W8B5T8_9FUNG|nr:hypothetical protein H4R34_004321 [Dimargaris verticillata]